jgi:hypothetical protein
LQEGTVVPKRYSAGSSEPLPSVSTENYISLNKRRKIEREPVSIEVVGTDTANKGRRKTKFGQFGNPTEKTGSGEVIALDLDPEDLPTGMETIPTV